MKKYGILLLAFLILCLRVSAQDAKTLESQRWSLVWLNGKRVKTVVPYIEFNFNANRFDGNAGCNRVSGSFENRGYKLKFLNVITLHKTCEKRALLDLERDFARSLTRTTRFRQQGNILRLYAGNRLVLSFTGTRRKVESNEYSLAVKLEEKKWLLIAIAGKPFPKIETIPFINFDRQKSSADGNSGCNSFGGSYKNEGASLLRITEIIQTERACIEDERLVIERKFFDGLQKASHYEIEGGKLFLYQNGKLLLTFEAREKT